MNLNLEDADIKTIIIIVGTALGLLALSPMFHDVFSSFGRFITDVGLFLLS